MSNQKSCQQDVVVPLVIRTIEVADFIHQLITRAPPGSRLIICHEEEEFLRQLVVSISKIVEHPSAQIYPRLDDKNSRHPLLITTLRQLSNSRNISVVFCPSLAVLHACLATHTPPNNILLVEASAKGAGKATTPPSTAAPYLVILNPLNIHRGTASFSAQGLSRTFASAVDAAFSASQRLIIAECRLHSVHRRDHRDEYQDHDTSSQAGDGEDNADPWDQSVPMLNTTSRSFGVGNRAWAGRTVTARQIIARWCVFEHWT